METEEDWDEEQLLLVELVGLLETNVLFKTSTDYCRLLGIDSDEPVLQIGPYIFVGHYEDVIGTHCIFEEIPSSNAEKKFHFKCITTKCLKMGRAFLKNKSEEHIGKNSDQSSSSDTSSNDGSDNDDGNEDDKQLGDINQDGRLNNTLQNVEYVQCSQDDSLSNT